MTNNNQHIPSGYKSSPLGIIPEDWEVKRLGEIARIGSGGTPSKANQEYWGGNIPWITTALLNNPYIDAVDEFITEQGLKNSSAQLLNSGVLLMAMYGQGQTRGKVSKLLIKASTNQACAFIDIHTGNTDFVHQHLIADYDSIRNKSNDGNQKNLSLGIINDIQITFPPIPEQQRIVSLLSLWDTAIEKQTVLIEKLTLRKRGLMQQLLTGKKRLEGFSGEWKEVRLGDVFDERNETNCNNLPLLSITGDKGVIYQSESDKRDISNEDKSKYKRICPNDIGYNTMRMWQGRSALSGLEGIVSPAYTIVTPKGNIDVRFMAMLIQQPRIVYDFWTHSQGLVSDTLNCKYPDFSQVKVSIPSKEEQTAVANFFVELDKEIELANKKLARLQEEKRGLMQVLLTGKKRIINKI